MYPKETNNGNSKLRYERTFTLAPKIQKLKNTKKGQLCTGMRQRLALTTHDGLDVLRYYSTMFFECNNRNREHCPVPAFDRYLQIFVLPLPDSNTAGQQQQQKMDDKNSSLFIDPYKFPSDEDIKKKFAEEFFFLCLTFTASRLCQCRKRSRVESWLCLYSISTTVTKLRDDTKKNR